jgi:phage terminase small subunit
MAKDKAPDRQIQFAQEYVVDFNGKQAAIRAGYSAKSAEVTACKMLRTAKVRSEIERLLADDVGRRNEIRERNINELLPLAYTDAAVEVKRDKDGNVIEVSFRDKLRAIELLGKMHGLFTDKIDVSGGLSLEVKQTVVKGEVKDLGTVDRRNQN